MRKAGLVVSRAYLGLVNDCNAGQDSFKLINALSSSGISSLFLILFHSKGFARICFFNLGSVTLVIVLDPGIKKVRLIINKHPLQV